MPTLAWSVIRAPNWGTRLQRAISGRELRVSDYANPIFKFTLTFEVLRSPSDVRAGAGIGPAWYAGGGGSPPFNEFDTLIAFFNQQQGAAIPFLWDDVTDNNLQYTVRFTKDALEFENFLYQLWTLKKLELTQVLP
jgi:Conserved hypothetical protein 2217 (DUF2460)